MSYNVTEVTPAPPTDLDIQTEIRNATNNGSRLICIEIDSQNNKLFIVTEE